MKNTNKLTASHALPSLHPWWSLVAFLMIASVMMTVWSPMAQAEATATTIESPVVLLERTTSQVIKILRQDRELLRQEPERVHNIINHYILPNLDDVTMAKLAMGKNWRRATNEQKRAFVKEFRRLLIRTYSRSLVEFKDQEIIYFPLTVPAGANRVTVEAQVLQPGGPPVPLAYRMRIKDNAWKVYDIKINGISLVTSYRGTFSQEIRKNGIDGLILFLQDKNSSVNAKDGV